MSRETKALQENKARANSKWQNLWGMWNFWLVSFHCKISKFLNAVVKLTANGLWSKNTSFQTGCRPSTEGGTEVHRVEGSVVELNEIRFFSESTITGLPRECDARRRCPVSPVVCDLSIPGLVDVVRLTMFIRWVTITDGRRVCQAVTVRRVLFDWRRRRTELDRLIEKRSNSGRNQWIV